MVNESCITSNNFAGIYKDIAEVIGIEATILLHSNFQGLQITFPKKLYNHEYIISQLNTREPTAYEIRALANRYGYTERRIRQSIKEKTTKEDI